MSRIINIIWKSVSVAVITSAIVAVSSIQAATISSVTHIPTSLKTSAASNHTLSFTTPTGVSEGSTITVTFDSSFDTSSIVENDIDITDDGVDISTASDCTGSEGASVAIATDIVTITICSGDGAAIAASSRVVIEIGSNATSSGTGSNQITNPSNAGTNFVSVAGTFGDVGSIALPISASNSAISVSVTIPTFSGGSALAPTPAPVPIPPVLDTDAPSISNIIVSEITTTSAKISWTTNENANSNLDYGTKEAAMSGLVSNVSLVTSHQALLESLSEGTTYYFQIRASDGSGNQGSSSVQTFSTLDITSPLITSKGVQDILGTSAKIVWTTNESTTGTVEYGLTNVYGSSKASLVPSLSHLASLSGLSSSTTYHYRVIAVDASSNQTISADGTFSTSNDLPPANVSGFSVVPGNAKNSLSWKNPTDIDFSGVKIIVCTNEAPNSPTDADCSQIYSSTGTSFQHTGLSNGTTYYYGAFSFDVAGQFASGALGLGNPSAPEEEVPLKEEKVIPKDVPEAKPAEKSSEKSEGQTEGQGAGIGQASEGSQGQSDSQTGSSSGTTGSTGSAEVCGNNICSEFESTLTCPKDCLSEEVSSLGKEEISISVSDISFVVGNGLIKLNSETGFIHVIGSSVLSIQIPAEKLGSGVKSVSIVLGPEKYLLRPVTASEKLSRAYGLNARGVVASKQDDVLYYVADIITPQETHLHPFTIFVDYEDKTKTISSFLNVVAPGYTFEVIDGEEIIIGEVRVTLYEDFGRKAVAWDGSPFRQFNPVTSGKNGAVAWYVQNGQYSAQAEHADYKTVKTGGFTVKNNIASPRIAMASIKRIEEPLTFDNAIFKASVAIDSTITAITEADVVIAVQESLNIIREIPGVEEAAIISVPTLVITAGASVVVMSVAFDFLPLLQYLFTAPVLFLWRRKRKGFGIVYNAVSKEPIDLAVVRLFQVIGDENVSGKLVNSRVTDKGGRFYFLVQPGKYKITATKAGFQFPSEYLAEEKEDGQYLEVYHSEVIEVTENDAVITPSVPLDPSRSEKFNKASSIRWRTKLRTIQHIVASSGVIASIAFAIIRPNVLAASMVVIQVGVFFAAKRIAKPSKPKSWGIVYDKETGRPLTNVVARIFEPKYNKLLETRVTDEKGRYSFLLGPSEYFAVFDKSGFIPTKVSPIDYKNMKESQTFSDDIHLNPGSSDSGSETMLAKKQEVLQAKDEAKPVQTEIPKPVLQQAPVVPDLPIVDQSKKPEV